MRLLRTQETRQETSGKKSKTSRLNAINLYISTIKIANYMQLNIIICHFNLPLQMRRAADSNQWWQRNMSAPAYKHETVRYDRQRAEQQQVCTKKYYICTYVCVQRPCANVSVTLNENLRATVTIGQQRCEQAELNQAQAMVAEKICEQLHSIMGLEEKRIDPWDAENVRKRWVAPRLVPRSGAVAGCCWDGKECAAIGRP